jgi:hypothetical protein
MPSPKNKVQPNPLVESANGFHPVEDASLSEPVESGGEVLEADIETGSLPTPEIESNRSTVSRKKLFIDTDEDLEDEIPVLASCSVHQPPKEIVFRVRPGKVWRAEALIVDFRQDDSQLARGKYLIVGPMQAKFKEFGRKVLLVTCVSSTGQVFLWDINVVRGFGDSWYKSDLMIAHTAETQWTRFLGSQGNAHAMRVSRKDRGEPHWPGEEVKDIYDLALLAFSEERMVESIDHPLCEYLEIE